MKRRLVSLGCMAIAAVFTCSMFMMKNNLIVNGNDLETLPLSYVKANLGYNVDDIREAVGVADYVFVGTVTEAEEVHHLMVTEDFGIPFTNYTVQVTENIKGELFTGQPIEVTKEGGVSLDKSCIVVFDNDEMPEVGKSYIFRAFAQSDGSLLVSGPKSNILFEDYASGTYSESNSSTVNPLLSEYIEACENEIDPHCRESQTSIYDVTYDEEK